MAIRPSGLLLSPPFFLLFHTSHLSLTLPPLLVSLPPASPALSSPCNHSLVCSGEGRLSWFDLNPETSSPFRTLSSASLPFYHVCFPRVHCLFAASTERRTIMIVRGSVRGGEDTSAVIVSVKMLA
jgi:hypothetical protein